MRLNLSIDCYLLSGLKNELHQSSQRLIVNKDTQAFRQLSLLGLGLWLLAALLFCVQGYHAAFFSLNQFTIMLPSEFWSMLTFMGDTTFALCLMLFFSRRNPAMLWVVLIAAVYGTLVSNGIKEGVGALRPPASLPADSYHLVGQAFLHRSFASGHSMTIFILVTLLFYFSRLASTRILLVLFGLCVAFSRVMVAAHWPVDVLVGAGLGIFTTLAAIYTAKRCLWGFKRGVHLFVLGLLLFATGMLFSYDGGYPQASFFAHTVATAALAFFITEYFLLPYQHPVTQPHSQEVS